jgi:hypothetical protein
VLKGQKADWQLTWFWIGFSFAFMDVFDHMIETGLIYRVTEKTSISLTMKRCSAVKTAGPLMPVSFTYPLPRFV